MRTMARLIIVEITGDQGRQVEPEELAAPSRDQIIYECDMIKAQLEELRESAKSSVDPLLESDE